MEKSFIVLPAFGVTMAIAYFASVKSICTTIQDRMLNNGEKLQIVLT